MYRFDMNGQMTMLGLDTAERGGAPPKRRPGKPDSELVSIPYFHLDLLSSPVDLFGQRHWELRSPWREGKRPLNTGAAPRRPIRVSLSGILEAYPSLKYYLSKTACLGILRRAFERGKDLPKMLARALKIQAGLMRPDGQLTNMQMQTFVTQPNGAAEGFDGYNGVMAFAANQRDEVRDLHDVAGVLGAQPGMKQQTFVAGFSAGAGAKAGGIGYNESVAPTLKGSPGGNCMPSVLCLNDQGGQSMAYSENITGTLRAQERGHQPLVLNPADPLLYENYGIDSRYTGPHKVAPTLSARMGTGGLNTSLVQQVPEEVICIAGNAIDRQPENGGNGLGCQEDLAYTLTATDRHAVVELYQKTVGALCRGDEKGIGNQYVSQDKCIINASCSETHHLIRRLTPLECERLQGFPDGWTDIPGASDSARYKALGNSVAIPCVEFIMSRIAAAMRAA
ncbi:DNA cytosine methyltransferase [Dysosmobacter sp.]|uniref:DNA cytosine methyltransferase n=1 Tax=Dysosmobacter sp. TaxID=2591382 RepID=UPI003AB2B4A2